MIVKKNFDFIFLGAGCATLSLLMRMIHSGQFNEKRILLIDKDQKTKNDRTWCFWEKEKGFFEEMVFCKWDTISFLSDDFSDDMDIAPYQYKMIRGVDFYQFCFDKIEKQANIETLYGTVEKWDIDNGDLIIDIDDHTYRFSNSVVFNSIYQPTDSKNTIKLLQHFKGWVVESEDPVFDPLQATMMDFRVHQNYGTSFVYVLPFSKNNALIEYTLFTKELLPSEKYDEELRNYIGDFLSIQHYKITEEEFGVIPMTNEKLSFKGHAWNIGTAGGQTKASSGYTFQFIQKQSQQILEYLLTGEPLTNMPETPGRFRFYDNTLLEVLYHDKVPGKEIFTTMFKKNKPQQVLRFLDNESSLSDELKIISSLPVWPFLKAAWKQL